MAFACIYCCPDVSPARPHRAHLFPHVLGGVTTTTDLVCQSCNERLGRELEQPAAERFAFFRSVLGIRGRRDVRAVRAILKIGRFETPITLDRHGDPPEVVVIPQSTERGRAYVVVGEPTAVEAKRAELAGKYPSLEWEPLETTDLGTPMAEFDLDLDLGKRDLRRLATKVALERLGMLRGVRFVTDEEFGGARRFVLDDDDGASVCGVVGDSQLLTGVLELPVPLHGVFIVGHPADRELGGFVTFWGLFVYWVILSARHSALGAWDDLLLEHPQTRAVESPALRARLGGLRVPWRGLLTQWQSDPARVAAAAAKFGIRKFQRAADAFYDARETTEGLPE